MIDLKSLREKALREGMKIMSNERIMKLMSNPKIMNVTMSAMQLRERVQHTVEEKGGALYQAATTRLKDLETRFNKLRGKAAAAAKPAGDGEAA